MPCKNRDWVCRKSISYLLRVLYTPTLTQIFSHIPDHYADSLNFDLIRRFDSIRHFDVEKLLFIVKCCIIRQQLEGAVPGRGFSY